jgi:ankyrin repeat protein
VIYCSSATEGFFKPQCCEILLEFGANPNRLNTDGLVPLNLAGPDPDIVKALLKHGADVNAGSKGVLTSAIEAGDAEILKLYLENGADCNIPDSSMGGIIRSPGTISRRYPLYKAASWPVYGTWDKVTARKMMKLLLEHGAKVDLAISDEETLIHYLFRTAPASILRVFLESPGLDYNIKDQKGRTVFLAACESQVELESDSGSGLVPFAEQDCFKAKYTSACMELVESETYGRSIDYLAADNDGRHAIHYLLPRWNNRISTRLLTIPGVRALIHQKDNHGFSPLHCALKDGNFKTCYYFVDECGVDLIEPDPNGDTTLHHLMRRHWRSELSDFRPLMDQYLSLGGDINARNKDGETALHVYLASPYLSPLTFTSSAPKQENERDPFEFFTTHGADFRAVKYDCETALHVVARRDGHTTFCNDEGPTNIDLFRGLVDLGCDPLQEDNRGRTALDVAAAVGNNGILGLYQRKKG